MNDLPKAQNRQAVRMGKEVGKMETEICIEIRPSNGSLEKAEEIIKKICEAYKHRNCTLRIKVKGVSKP